MRSRKKLSHWTGSALALACSRAKSWGLTVSPHAGLAFFQTSGESKYSSGVARTIDDGEGGVDHLAQFDAFGVLALLVADRLAVDAGGRDREEEGLLAGDPRELHHVPELGVLLAVQLVEDRRGSRTCRRRSGASEDMTSQTDRVPLKVIVFSWNESLTTSRLRSSGGLDHHDRVLEDEAGLLAGRGAR